MGWPDDLPEDFVTTLGNRPCITEENMVELQGYAPELAQWLYEHCEHAVDPHVYLLPVFDNQQW